MKFNWRTYKNKLGQIHAMPSILSKTLLKEHQRAVKTFDTNASVLAEHVMHADHRVAWEDATVMDHHPLLSSRLLVESWYICKTPDTLNRENGPLPEQYAGLRP